ncbi:MAG: XAC2610-related protein [Flavobacteriales bacterium]
MKRIFTILIITILFNSCVKKQEKTLTLNGEKNIENKTQNNEIEILCDSIYPNKKYSIKLYQINDSPPQSLDENSKNYFFELKQNGKNIFVDSIFSIVAEINFRDFNNDGIKDVLIQNDSDVRSNWTYNLYLIDTLKNSLKKVKGFNQIKNPNFIVEYNLIDNEVMSGRNWTSFYQIKKDTIFDFGYIIYKGMNDDGAIVDFDKEYQKTLRKVLNNKNYR